MHKTLMLFRAGPMLSALCCASACTIAQETPMENQPANVETYLSLPEAIRQGDLRLRLRLRHEHLNSENISNSADASTLLMRIDYQSLKWRNLKLAVQLDDVLHIGAENFNDTRNQRSAYPVVPDPDGFTLNSLHLDWTGIDSTHFTLGRQCLDYDYIGCNGLAWRQNDPVDDALSVTNTSLQQVTITAAYITAMQTPFGPHTGVPAATVPMHSATVITEYNGWTNNRLGLHLYRFNSEEQAATSSNSAGLRLDGSHPFGAWQWLYGAQYFTQADTGPNPNNYRALNYFMESGVSYRGWTAMLSRDVLEGDASLANHQYTRPFNVVHYHLGWAGKFANIPATGIEDLFFTLNTTLSPKTRSKIVFHDFHSQASSRHFGQEWDGQLLHDFNPHLQGLLKFATYKAADTAADNAGVNTNIMWAQILLSY